MLKLGDEFQFLIIDMTLCPGLIGLMIIILSFFLSFFFFEAV